jgi:hypothetical protein
MSSKKPKKPKKDNPYGALGSKENLDKLIKALTGDSNNKPSGGGSPKPTPPSGGSSSGGGSGKSTPGVAGTGYWSTTGWVNDPSKDEYGNPKAGGSTPPAVTPASTTPSSLYAGSSIVDYLSSTGQASDFNTRAKLAAEQGITNYTGTAAQNTQLLNNLRSGSTGTTTPETPAVTPPTIKTEAEFDYDAYIEKPDKTITDQENIIRQLREEAAKPETDAQARERITERNQADCRQRRRSMGCRFNC